ncbi:hypothetical protein OsJ_27358 [Oryza sativa Japonica Group]|uniref:Uncharacterized protein n=1 Tax=Oryza sativa subsp. japonica TaxID=39947 RepID=Q6YZ88_ORYSJ|nr:hypothetical protein OsJ_27358 [Oryza sativa Japonica Group]BAC24971.1 hypothetical protein [Oryza sativa Japonica Group]BAC99791.1 hypothetical protein [Oryza sativa Japonica Group]
MATAAEVTDSGGKSDNAGLEKDGSATLGPGKATMTRVSALANLRAADPAALPSALGEVMAMAGGDGRLNVPYAKILFRT